jgi:hypothetical protein
MGVTRAREDGENDGDEGARTARMPAKMRRDRSRPQCGLHKEHTGLHSLLSPTSMPWEPAGVTMGGRLRWREEDDAQ